MNATEANDTNVLLACLLGRRQPPAGTLSAVATRLADRAYRALSAGIGPGDIPADLSNPWIRTKELEGDLAKARLELAALRRAAARFAVLAEPSEELLAVAANAWILDQAKRGLISADAALVGEAHLDLMRRILPVVLPAILAHVEGVARG